MENQTLQVSETVSTATAQQLKLIEGKFTKLEAISIINNVVDVKINFHKLQRLSKTEGDINDQCSYDNSRISELIDDKADIKRYLRSLESKDCNIKISSTIHISIED